MKAEKAHAPAIAYVLGLAKEHRVRLAGKFDTGGRTGGWIEFRSKQQHAADRLSVAQLEEMGLTVMDRGYGYEIVADGETLIVTA